jgi:hypothetical protein
VWEQEGKGGEEIGTRRRDKDREKRIGEKKRKK